MTLVVPPASAEVLPVIEAFLVRAAVRPQLLDVAVRVDAARHHQQSVGIDTCGAVQLLAERGDAAAAHADIGAEHIRRRHHRAAADHQIIIGHATLRSDA